MENEYKEAPRVRIGKALAVTAVIAGILLWFFLLLAPFLGCNGSLCHTNLLQDVSSFHIVKTDTTPGGIQLDLSEASPDYPLKLTELDDRVRQIEACFLNTAAEMTLPSYQELALWQCLRDPKHLKPLDKRCLTVKVVPPVLSKCQTQYQLLPVSAPDSLCIAKGLVPSKECPCLWRTVVQGNSTIVTPPAMYLWEVGKIWTSCNNLWASPFAPCLSI